MVLISLSQKSPVLLTMLRALCSSLQSSDPSQVAADSTPWRHGASGGDGLHLVVDLPVSMSGFSAMLFSLPSDLELVALQRIAPTELRS